MKTSGVAFHSPYMKLIAGALREKLLPIICEPKVRSARWISSSITESDWSSSLARTCSADYHVNNLTSPVLFYEALRKVPENALVIEVIRDIGRSQEVQDQIA